MCRQRLFGVLTLACLGACGPATSVADTDTDGGSSSSSGEDTGTPPPAEATSAEGSSGAQTSTSGTGTSVGDSSGAGSSGDTGLPAGDGCCEAHEGPGCNEAPVQQCVCEVEQTCCLFDWDETCVALAEGKCAATCESSGDTGSTGGDPTTGGMSNTCDEPVVIEISPEEAELTGAWQLGMSQVGEGTIIRLPQFGGSDGEIIWNVDVPCDDAWIVWVRYFEQGSDDSYYVQVDGEPEFPVVFEGDCTGGGQGYGWRALNYREEGSNPCESVEDPWLQDWDAGAHAVAFSFRESVAMGRIVVTNDPDYLP